MKLYVHSSLIALSAAALSAAVAVGSTTASHWSVLRATDPAVIMENGPPADYRPAIQVAANAPRYLDGSFTGKSFDAYYGLVRVQANIKSGQIASIDVLEFPNDQRTSRAINRQALPVLESEVISSQDIDVDIISGATLTSVAYLRSLNGALSQAGPQ
jgi:uncharacterized protein with FMN-binding domain